METRAHRAIRKEIQKEKDDERRRRRRRRIVVLLLRRGGERLWAEERIEMDREFPQIRKKNVFVFFSARGNDAEVISRLGGDDADDSFVVPVVAKVSWDRRRCRAARRVVLYG